ncbi:MAG TPA: hypothetical protein VGY58_24375 [Gemmataceae bacterium]|jgi:hypothetical protein|nr:hypothetical protein [Gemmataceae bacterium]
MNDLAKKYSDRLTFVFIYAREAHPPSLAELFAGEEDLSTVAPQKAVQVYQARRDSGRNLRTRLADNWHVLIDDYGQRGAKPSYMCYLDNPLFVIGTDGKIVKTMEWTDADKLDQFFRTYLADSHRD